MIEKHFNKQYNEEMMAQKYESWVLKSFYMPFCKINVIVQCLKCYCILYFNVYVYYYY